MNPNIDFNGNPLCSHHRCDKFDGRRHYCSAISRSPSRLCEARVQEMVKKLEEYEGEKKESEIVDKCPGTRKFDLVGGREHGEALLEKLVELELTVGEQDDEILKLKEMIERHRETELNLFKTINEQRQNLTEIITIMGREKQELKTELRRIREDFRVMVGSEHLLSASYVRIREIIGAIKGAPINGDMWEYTEDRARVVMEKLAHLSMRERANQLNQHFFSPKKEDDCSVKSRSEKLRNVIETQCQDGTWNRDSYNHGMANGLILAESIVSPGTDDPAFLDAPKRWKNKVDDRLKYVCFQLKTLRNEIDCRIDHGAAGKPHLQYVNRHIDVILEGE